VIDRFFTFLPGWEIPKNSSEYLTEHYGFITDYLSEAFHLLVKQSRYDYVTNNCRFGPSIEGRDEIAVKRTVAALLKLLHPSGEPTTAELEEYMAYAIEGRRRIKEQLNKRKHDDEYARVNLSYFDSHGNEIIVWCPESQHSSATQHPLRKKLPGAPDLKPSPELKPKPPISPAPEAIEPEIARPARSVGLREEHYTIYYGDTGYSYEAIFGKYLESCQTVLIQDPYIRQPHQIQNLIRFCELAVKVGTVRRIQLITGYDSDLQRAEVHEKFEMLQESLQAYQIDFQWNFNQTLHDRAVILDSGWVIKIGRGLDIYQKPDNWFSIGCNDLDLRPCLETMVDIYLEKK